MSAEIDPILVYVDFTPHFREGFLASEGATKAGVIYLADRSVRSFLCSAEPHAEMYLMTCEVWYEDGAEPTGEVEHQTLLDLHEVDYYHWRSIGGKNYPCMDAHDIMPDREEGETDDNYWKRAVEEVRDYLSGNGGYVHELMEKHEKETQND